MEIPTRGLLTFGKFLALGAVVSSRGFARHLAGAGFAGLWLYPTLRRNCQWHGPVLTRFQTSEKQVWLTIDDGPHLFSSHEFLDLLDQFRARASFFVVGRRVEAMRSVVMKMSTAGHTVENHSYSHPSGGWWALPGPLIRQEIARTSTAILTATGRKPKFFRCPVGMCPPGVHPAAAAENLKVLGWSNDGCDGCISQPSQVVGRIFRKLTPGDIILLHEGDRSRQRLMTLKLLLEGLRERGYECVIPSPDSLV